MGKHLVLVGGGHAHMVTLANLQEIIDKGHKVTVIGPSEYHYYSGMGPGMLSKTYTPDDIRFATKHVVEKNGGTFVLDYVTHIDADKKVIYLKSGNTISYDVISFNAGSHVPQNNVIENNGDIYSVKPIESLLEAQQRLLALASEREITIGVVGGGPASVEVAGNTWRLLKDHGKHNARIQMFAGKKLMSKLPDNVRKKARKSLTKRGIEIIELGYVREIKTGYIMLDTGREFHTDFIILAQGVKPSPIFKTSGLPIGPDGGLKVNKYLQSTGYHEIFGGGDCIYFEDQPLDKVGVYAVRENPILYANMMASLEGGELTPFDPGGDYLLIYNMGDDTGVLKKRWVFFGGKLAFFIKDYIDRKFMRHFQAIEN